MIIPLNTDGWIAFDADGEYLTLFLDEPMRDERGRWYVENPSRSMIVQQIGNPSVEFQIGEKILRAGEKLEFEGLIIK